MKKVISGNELKTTMQEAINLLCDTVKATLGPTGNNVLINSNETSPYITNDGVTIAQNIESDNPVINAILEIAKEASLQTNSLVGDGTTTTLVLLQSIFNQALKLIDEGINPLILKNELNEATNLAINKLNNLKKLPNSKNLLATAINSANDTNLGTIVYNVFKKVNNANAIKIKEGNKEITEYKIVKGYNLEHVNTIDYLIKEKEIILKNPYVLLLKGYLDNLDILKDILIALKENSKSLLVIAEDLEPNLKNDILYYFLEENINIIIVENPDYASRKNIIYNDLAIFTKANVINIKNTIPTWNDLGFVKEVIISNDNINIINEPNSLDYQNLIKNLDKDINNCLDDYEKEFLIDRLAKLKNGIAYIYIGGITQTEKREKLMRTIDAVCALNVAKNGVLPGAGLAYLQIQKEFDLKDNGSKLIYNALTIPFEQILKNNGLDSLKYLEIAKKKNYQEIFNIHTKTWENINKSNIIDPLLVNITALKNASSIASMLFTTSSVVVNERKIDNLEL